MNFDLQHVTYTFEVNSFFSWFLFKKSFSCFFSPDCENYLKMDYTLLFMCFCSLTAVMAENEQTECSATEYFSKKSNECLPCTLCGSSNTIIRVPCSEFADTVCGPFLEFDRFHQAPIINLLPAENDTTKVLVTGSISSHGGSFQSSQTHGSVPVEMVTDERWYNLAMALVGVLSFVSLIIIIYITIYCFVCRKHREEKELIYYPGKSACFH